MDASNLWSEFHGELRAFLRARVDSDAAADDILQSAFLRAHERLASGDAVEHPRAWIYQIVRNLIVDAHRRVGRDVALAQAIAREPASSTADAEGAFEVVARALPLFIRRLDPPYREALEMTELEGLTQAEAARRAGLSVPGMKSRVQRGRAQVRAALLRCCEFELDARGHMIECTHRAPAATCCE